MSVLLTLNGIVNDLADSKVKPTSNTPLRDLIETSLWAGFVFDVQTEFSYYEGIDPGLTQAQLAQEIIENLAEEGTALPESTLIIHFDDEYINEMLDDLETVLEKYNIPYVMKLYTHREGGKLNKELLLRASSHEEVFDAYHDRVMAMFRK